MSELSGKVCVITGASGAIGGAIALVMARERAAGLVLTYNKHGLDDLLCELAKLDCLGIAIQLDVRSQVDCDSLARLVRNSLGRVDVLVNNAGLNNVGNLAELSDGDFREVIDVDLTGQWRVTKVLWPLLSDKAAIINIGSVCGHIGGPRTPSYAAAKLGLVALTHNMALEGAKQGIRAVCVAPGYIASRMTDKSTHDADKRVANAITGIPLGRKGHVDEVAEVVSFLASDRAGYITGVTIHVSGGLVLGT